MHETIVPLMVHTVAKYVLASLIKTFIPEEQLAKLDFYVFIAQLFINTRNVCVSHELLVIYVSHMTGHSFSYQNSLKILKV